MKKQPEFSKTLLKQESALIWILSLSFIALAFYCIHEGFTGSLPWLAAMVGFPWTAYGVSQMMYYKKAMKENISGGIKYDSIMEEIKRVQDQYDDATGFNFEQFEDGIDPFANPEAKVYEVTENVDEYQI